MTRRFHIARQVDSCIGLSVELFTLRAGHKQWRKGQRGIEERQRDQINSNLLKKERNSLKGKEENLCGST